MIETAVFVIFPFCMVFAALSDMITMTIANRVSLILVGAFFVLATLTGMPLADMGWHLAAGIAVLSVTFTLFAIGGMGGGDAKLMAATAVWFGLSMPLVEYLMTSAILGGVLTLALLAYRRSPLAVFTGNNLLLRNFADAQAGIPYGVALGIGGLLTYTQSPLALWAIVRLIAA